MEIPTGPFGMNSRIFKETKGGRITSKVSNFIKSVGMALKNPEKYKTIDQGEYG